MEALICMLAAGVAVAALALHLHEARRRSRLLGSAGDRGQRRSPAIRVARALSDPAQALALQLGLPPRLPAVERVLAAAGLDGDLPTWGLMAATLLAAIIGATGARAAGGGHPILAPCLGAAAVLLAIAAALRRRMRERREAIERTLPFALDGLTLCVEAGSDFAQAVARVAGRLRPGPLAEVWQRLDAALRAGIPRREALAAMAHDAHVPGLASLAALLIQADRLGSGMGPVLRAASARLRAARFAAAERRGAIAAQLVLLPLVACIMPASFVVIFGPIAVRVATGGIAALL